MLFKLVVVEGSVGDVLQWFYSVYSVGEVRLFTDGVHRTGLKPCRSTTVTLFPNSVSTTVPCLFLRNYL